MCALVAYDDSGSDISDSDEEIPSQRAQNCSAPSVSTTSNDVANASHSANLFQSLPEPKNSNTIKKVFEEDDDEFLHKKETPVELPSKPPPITKAREKKAQIFLPSLSDFNDEDDDCVKMAPKFKPSSKGTGLLNLLPQPKSAQILEQTKKKALTSLVPDSVKNKGVVSNNFQKTTGISTKSTSNKVTKPTKSNLPLIKCDSSEDSDAEIDEKEADFFSLNKSEEEFPPCEDILITDKRVDPAQIDVPSASSRVQETVKDVNLEESPAHYNEHELVTSSTVDIDQEALRKLAGTQARRRGDVMQFIDIDQKEILPDTREWLTKALTEDTSKRMSSSKRRGDEPTHQQKRKHHITYLAHQAKANEQELQNQWANNRVYKKQTQSKYGF